MVTPDSQEVSEYSVYAPADVEAMRELLGKVTSREKVIKKEWLDKTKDIFTIYEGGKADETPFNILYSNTEVLVPNLFANTPKPSVRRRFGENRADEAALAAERMAEYCMDTNLADYPSFPDCIESGVLAAALPGQGQARLRLVDGVAVVDYVQHDMFGWGYAKRWEDTPWIAYYHDKTHEEIVRDFRLSPEAASGLVDTSESDSTTKDKGPATIRVYEVWRKSDKKVCFLCESYKDVCLDEQDDPLQLRAFFPSGKPLRLLSTPISTMPSAMYNLYKSQAEELNTVTKRIKRVAQAIQVKGIVDASLPEMANLFDVANAENTLTPASQPGGMAREGGLDRHIWLVPIDKFVVVLQQLFQIREAIKSTIYEILGIGDILRGVSAASETASAQQIKDKWGSLRIKKSRERVSEFVRFQVRGIVELAAKHTPEEIWAQVTGLDYATQQEVMISQISGMRLEKKAWADVLGQLRDDAIRSYIIDIETNSTVDADATEGKKEITEFMNAIGQAMPALGGIAMQGDEGHRAATSLLVEICKRFQMGGEVQRLLMSIKPQPKGPTEEQVQLQQEIEQLSSGAKAEAAKVDKMKVVFELQVQEAKLELQKQRFQQDQQMQQVSVAQSQKDLELKEREHEVIVSESQTKTEASKVEAVAVASTAAQTSLDAVVHAVTAQNAITAMLLETMANPPKMIIKKTGPSTFERTTE